MHTSVKSVDLQKANPEHLAVNQKQERIATNRKGPGFISRG